MGSHRRGRGRRSLRSLAPVVTAALVFGACAAGAAAQGTPIVPPQNPPANGTGGNCATDVDCLAAANTVRSAQEGLAPLTLPSNWTTLTPAEQIFVDDDLERASRGLPTIASLVNTYDGEVQTGMLTDADPMLVEQVGYDSVWAGGNATVLGAMYGWLYDDGAGDGNLDCTTPTDAGCWGHRAALLDNAGGNIVPNEMDAVVGTDQSGQTSYAAAVVQDPNPAPAANVVFTWAQEQPFLAPPTLGGVSPHGRAPRLAHLALSRSAFGALAGLKKPAVILDVHQQGSVGAIVSYTDSERSSETMTIAHAGGQRIGSFLHTDVVGRNRFRYTGRINGVALVPGRYRLTLSPLSPGHVKGARSSITFTIRK